MSKTQVNEKGEYPRKPIAEGIQWKLREYGGISSSYLLSSSDGCMDLSNVNLVIHSLIKGMAKSLLMVEVRWILEFRERSKSRDRAK